MKFNKLFGLAMAVAVACANVGAVYADVAVAGAYSCEAKPCLVSEDSVSGAAFSIGEAFEGGNEDAVSSQVDNGHKAIGEAIEDVNDDVVSANKQSNKKSVGTSCTIENKAVEGASLGKYTAISSASDKANKATSSYSESRKVALGTGVSFKNKYAVLDESLIKGDADLDGVLDSADASLILSKAIDPSLELVCDAYGVDFIDMDGDGVVSASDAAVLLGIVMR